MRGSRSRRAIKKSFCGVQLWPIVVAGTVSILVVGEKFRQRPGFTVLLLRRRNVDETERLRQPADTVEKTFGLLRHIRLLQMVDQLRRLLAFRFPNRFEDAGFCNAAEIVVDGWSPPCLDHVEPDGPRQNIGLVKPGTNAVGGDTALIVAVSRLVKCVHRK